ncbi:MAG: hypothetical protein M1835_006403 [Candelina submexicana]|nr:MAG: hypothetical protein M1835_006403 [Candelina submexicana]
MDTYETFLGKYQVTGGFKEVGKRLHWFISIGKKEVGELRAVVVSQILAINTLLNAQHWECLQALETRQGANARALESLISTTTAFAQRMDLCLRDKDDLQNKIQQVIDLVTTDRQEDQGHRQAMNRKITTSRSLVRTLSRRCKSSLATVRRIQKNTSKALKGTSRLAAKLDQGLRMIFSYSAEILAAIQRNMQMLLELSAMIKTLQRWLPKHIDLPIIRFDDALGNTMALPLQMCSEWKVNCNLVIETFW